MQSSLPHALLVAALLTVTACASDRKVEHSRPDAKPAPAPAARLPALSLAELLAQMDAADAEVRDYSCRLVVTSSPAANGGGRPSSRESRIWRLKPDLQRTDDEYTSVVKRLDGATSHEWIRSLREGTVSESDVNQRGLVWPSTDTPEGQLRILHKWAGQPAKKRVDPTVPPDPAGYVVTVLLPSMRQEYLVDPETWTVTRMIQYQGDEVATTQVWSELVVNGGLGDETFAMPPGGG